MALNWTLKSLRFGSHGGQYARAPTSDAALPDLSVFSAGSGKLTGPTEEPSFIVRYGFYACTLCCCLGIIALIVVAAIGCFASPVSEMCGGPGELTAEAILEELGSGNSLLAVVR